MQAYGGLLPVDQAAAQPVGMIESGPVSGLVGCQTSASALGFDNIIAADMGGTTFKVGTVRKGLIEYQRESMVLRYHYALPKMDVVSLGLAGGSIISIDPRTGAPGIGPRSAGSYPGPVCYDHGGKEPTITDMDAILGYLNPDFFLGGSGALDIDKAARVFEDKVAAPLGLRYVEAAAAMYKLANSLFYDLLHKTTVQRGLDPRRFALFSFGGTAGMHVCAYGEELGVSHIVIPHSASVHGAYGLMTSDIAHEDQITHPLRHPVTETAVAEHVRAAPRPGRLAAAQEGFGDQSIRLSASIDMRYRRQVHIVTVPVVGDGEPITAQTIEGPSRIRALYRRSTARSRRTAMPASSSSASASAARAASASPSRSSRSSAAKMPSDAIVKTGAGMGGQVGSIEEVPATTSSGWTQATDHRPGDRLDADHDARDHAGSDKPGWTSTGTSS